VSLLVCLPSRSFLSHLLADFDQTWCTSGSGVMAGKHFRVGRNLVEEAELAHKFMKQICRAPHAAHWIETRMSVALPVPKKLRENTSGFGKVAGKHLCVGKTGRSTDSLQAHKANNTNISQIPYSHS
jgi:hypothetical protein